MGGTGIDKAFGRMRRTCAGVDAMVGAGGRAKEETVNRMAGACAGVAATVGLGMAAFAPPVP